MLVYLDIFLEIGKLLTDKDKIYLSSSSKILIDLKCKFIYHEKINIKKIITLPYFNNFECVEINNNQDMYPKYAKYIHFVAYTIEIPPFVTHLIFGNNFNEPIKNIIPHSVTHLNFGCCFNQPIEELPPSITHLTFGVYFDQPIQHIIPRLVTHLTFGRMLKQPIDNIPPSVTHLTGHGFRKTNQKLSSITHYTHYATNMPLIINQMPHIMHLTFGIFFDGSIDNLIPKTIKHLIFGITFNKPIINNIPLSVTHLTFGVGFNQPIDKTASNVTHLTLDNLNISITTEQFFEKVTHLRFGFHFNKSIKGYISPSVKYLEFGPKFAQSLNDIPSSVIQIKICKIIA